MSARRLDGAALARTIREELRERVRAFTNRAGRPPRLDVVLAGDDPASQIYVRNKERAAAESGLLVTLHRLPSDATVQTVLTLVRRLNDDPSCDGILVQSPLPAGMGKSAEQAVFDSVDPRKDVDGFHPTNVGLLAQGRAHLVPCTPLGVIELLVRNDVVLAGRHAVVIGRSDIVGKPVAMLLLQKDATVTVCHSRTRDLPAVAALADVLVVAVGRPAFVTRSFVKAGAAVVDVGITRMDDRQRIAALFGSGSEKVAEFDKKGSVIAGDVHPDAADVAGFLSPVPGGVGPLTIAMLLKNTLAAAETRLSDFRPGA